MRFGVPTVVICSCMLLAPALLAAQVPVASFDQLNTRLKPGDTIWITDAEGREIQATIQTLGPDEISMKGHGGRAWRAQDVRLIRQRAHDSLRNGALIGFCVGAGFMVLNDIGEIARGESASDEWAMGVAFIAVSGGFGAAIGVGVDAMIPGKKLDVYRAPTSRSTAQPRLSIAPVITPRHKAVAVSFAF